MSNHEAKSHLNVCRAKSNQLWWGDEDSNGKFCSDWVNFELVWASHDCMQLQTFSFEGYFDHKEQNIMENNPQLGWNNQRKAK